MSDAESGVPANKRLKHDGDESPVAGHSVHGRIIANHYNGIQETGIQQRKASNIFFMRNFNNWIKTELINKYLAQIRAETSRHLGTPIKVLDMCCGKGGDLFKWKQARINHLVCTDIAEISLEQCRERYNEMKERRDSVPFTLETHVCDATVESQRAKYADPTIQFNLVSCQFALHYCFESLPQAERMLKNAAECLKPGGYFIGTIPDANVIMLRHRMDVEAGGSGTEIGNSVNKINFECNMKKPPIFGAKYNFYLDGVVNCPEFLVHFPVLERLARKFGLRLVEKTGFHEFFEECNQKGRFLMEKMSALETYPPRNPHHMATIKDSENYRDVSREFESNRNRYGHQVGTMSKAEWDTVGIYLVFAFVKMKFTWSAEGRPIYEED